MSNALQTLSDLMSESEVYEKYPHIFADKELREARQTGELEFYKLRKGIFYREDQLIAYLEQRKQRPCPSRPLFNSEIQSAESGSTSNTGLAGRPDLRTITGTGISQRSQESAEDELIERALERPISLPPRKR
jgi:hypothetical protein